MNHGLVYTYKSALDCVNIGPVNISGVQFYIERWYEQACHELAQSDPEFKALDKELRVALDTVGFDVPTITRNQDPEVVRIITLMTDMAFRTETLRQVPSHPLIRLPLSQMAQLAGYVCDEPLFQDRWAEAYSKATAYHDKLVADEEETKVDEFVVTAGLEEYNNG